MGEKLSLPVGDMFGLPKIEMSAGYLTVENHRGVVSYTDFEITVSGGKHLIAVSGQRLCIFAMSRGQITIQGDIKKIEFIG